MLLCKPEVAIRSGRDAVRGAGRSWERKLADLPGWGDAPDPAVVARAPACRDATFRKPEIAIGSGRDCAGNTLRSWERKLADLPGWSDAPNLAGHAVRPCMGGTIRKPEVAIRPGRDASRGAPRR